MIEVSTKTKFKLNFALCRMVSLPVVRFFFLNDGMNLAGHFVAYDYMEGNEIFYVALENNDCY